MEKILMNGIKTLSENEKVEVSDEALSILQDAENIILSSTTDISHKKRKKVILCTVIPVSSLIVLLLLLSTIFALININNNKIMNGVFVQGIDISNLTVEEAKQKVSSIVNEHMTSQILVKHLDFEGIFPQSSLALILMLTQR